MTSPRMPNETVVVLTSSGIKFPQAETLKPSIERQDNLLKCLKAEIKVLGTIQIMCGLMVLILGIILAFSSSSPQFTPVVSILLKAAYPFLGALCFVISGSLSIVTEKKPTKPLVQSSLVANFLSCLSGAVGFILLCINVFSLDRASQLCDLDKAVTPTMYYSFYYHRYEDRECFMATTTVTGMIYILLIFTVAELCLAVLSSMRWWNQAHTDFQGVRLLFGLTEFCLMDLTFWTALNYVNKSDRLDRCLVMR
ncbi:PREDICTED: membrane-spanning 4-domains subfamily A member 6A [Elephantulus edwardii]|uniref:membrane-spanning 4-domains subfamily A member 6A n=1 Tax=Elephantulus edwardii TaxID=28737 RepID=UPI0003F07A18|nr:PREDICTED: membrane-spanning 4-domains subfamily A member 6A [Elephantulus edwardii]